MTEISNEQIQLRIINESLRQNLELCQALELEWLLSLVWEQYLELSKRHCRRN